MVEDLTKDVRVIKRAMRKGPCDSPVILPLKTLEELEAAERALTDPGRFKEMVGQLLFTTKTSVHLFAKCCLTKLLCSI